MSCSDLFRKLRTTSTGRTIPASHIRVSRKTSLREDLQRRKGLQRSGFHGNTRKMAIDCSVRAAVENRGLGGVNKLPSPTALFESLGIPREKSGVVFLKQHEPSNSSSTVGNRTPELASVSRRKGIEAKNPQISKARIRRLVARLATKQVKLCIAEAKQAVHRRVKAANLVLRWYRRVCCACIRPVQVIGGDTKEPSRPAQRGRVGSMQQDQRHHKIQQGQQELEQRRREQQEREDQLRTLTKVALRRRAREQSRPHRQDSSNGRGSSGRASSDQSNSSLSTGAPDLPATRPTYQLLLKQLQVHLHEARAEATSPSSCSGSGSSDKSAATSSFHKTTTGRRTRKLRAVDHTRILSRFIRIAAAHVRARRMSRSNQASQAAREVAALVAASAASRARACVLATRVHLVTVTMTMTASSQASSAPCTSVMIAPPSGWAAMTRRTQTASLAAAWAPASARATGLKLSTDKNRLRARNLNLGTASASTSERATRKGPRGCDARAVHRTSAGTVLPGVMRMSTAAPTTATASEGSVAKSSSSSEDDRGPSTDGSMAHDLPGE